MTILLVHNSQFPMSYVLAVIFKECQTEVSQLICGSPRPPSLEMRVPGTGAIKTLFGINLQ